jgi:hypothetical protein
MKEQKPINENELLRRGEKVFEEKYDEWDGLDEIDKAALCFVEGYKAALKDMEVSQ